MEDVATGLLAELCGVACRQDGWIWEADPTGQELEFIADDIKTGCNGVQTLVCALETRRMGPMIFVGLNRYKEMFVVQVWRSHERFGDK